MPRLGSLLICEKVVIDQGQKPTLISLFQKVSAFFPPDQEVPKEIMALTSWTVFTEWFFSEDERTKSFAQSIQVMNPDGTPSPIKTSVVLKEIASSGQGSRVYINITGFPIAQVGMLQINVWLESDGQSMTEIYSYPLQVEHTKEPPANQADGSGAVQLIAPQRQN